MVVEGRGQTSECELCALALASLDSAIARLAIGSRPGRGAFEEASAVGNLATPGLD